MALNPPALFCLQTFGLEVGVAVPNLGLHVVEHDTDAAGLTNEIAADDADLVVFKDGEEVFEVGDGVVRRLLFVVYPCLLAINGILALHLRDLRQLCFERKSR